MPPKYPDRRASFRGVGQWEVPAGNARPDNPVKNSDPVTDIASRGQSPRDAFRVSTTTDPVLLAAQAEAQDIAKAQKY